MRDFVLLNAGAALVVAGLAENLREGVRLAARTIDEGAAINSARALRAPDEGAFNAPTTATNDPGRIVADKREELERARPPSRSTACASGRSRQAPSPSRRFSRRSPPP
jgi:anthranilate phosphoribosyltransferase